MSWSISRRLQAVPIALITAVLLVGCGSGSAGTGVSNAPADVITPAQARAFASGFAVKRIKALETDDEQTINSAETWPASESDLAIARVYQEVGHGLPPAKLSRVDAYVAHQRSYPATFLATVVYSDKSGDFMGFRRESSSDSWKLVVEVSESSDTAKSFYSRYRSFTLNWKILRDKYVPDPSGPDSAAAYSASDASTAITEWLGRAVVGMPPVSNSLATHVDGELLAPYAASIVAFGKAGYRHHFLVGDGQVPNFPGYALTDGSTLDFVAFNVEFDVLGGSGCITLSQQGQYIDPSVPAGKFSGVTLRRVYVVAVVVPPRASAATEMKPIAWDFVATLTNPLHSSIC